MDECKPLVAGSRSALRLLDSQWHWVVNPTHGGAVQVDPKSGMAFPGSDGFGGGLDFGGFGRIPGPQIQKSPTQPQVDPE